VGLEPSERRQLLAMMNMAVGLQNQIAAMLGEDAETDEPEEPAHPGEVMGRRLFMQHMGGETKGGKPKEARGESQASEVGQEGITRPRGSRKRHSG
jgi:hypothetical protein